MDNPQVPSSYTPHAMDALRALARKYFPYVLAVMAGGVGYTEGDQQVIQKCVAGVTASAPVAAKTAP